MILKVVLIYLGVFALIQIAMRLALRREPTAHGQIIGQQVGCLIGALWPIALPYFAIVGICLGARWLWHKARP